VKFSYLCDINSLLLDCPKLMDQSHWLVLQSWPLHIHGCYCYCSEKICLFVMWKSSSLGQEGKVSGQCACTHAHSWAVAKIHTSHDILDFKLLLCSECCMLSSG
jgi:hypothetical protein